MTDSSVCVCSCARVNVCVGALKGIIPNSEISVDIRVRNDAINLESGCARRQEDGVSPTFNKDVIANLRKNRRFDDDNALALW